VCSFIQHEVRAAAEQNANFPTIVQLVELVVSRSGQIGNSKEFSTLPILPLATPSLVRSLAASHWQSNEPKNEELPSDGIASVLFATIDNRAAPGGHQIR
jgi:hypothetical protein